MSKDKRQWCVTGINRLTRQREAVTPPCSRENAEKVYLRNAGKPARKRSYIYLKLQEYSWYMDHPTVQTTIKFNE